MTSLTMSGAPCTKRCWRPGDPPRQAVSSLPREFSTNCVGGGEPAGPHHARSGRADPRNRELVAAKSYCLTGPVHQRTRCDVRHPWARTTHRAPVSAIPGTGHASCPTQGNSLSRVLCPAGWPGNSACSVACRARCGTPASRVLACCNHPCRNQCPALTYSWVVLKGRLRSVGWSLEPALISLSRWLFRSQRPAGFTPPVSVQLRSNSRGWLHDLFGCKRHQMQHLYDFYCLLNSRSSHQLWMINSHFCGWLSSVMWLIIIHI